MRSPSTPGLDVAIVDPVRKFINRFLDDLGEAGGHVRPQTGQVNEVVQPNVLVLCHGELAYGLQIHLDAVRVPRIPLFVSQFAPGSGSDGGSTLASFDVRLVSSRYARGDHGDRHKAMLAGLQRAVKLSADKRGGFVLPLSRETWIGLPTNRQTWVVCLERIKVLGRGATPNSS